MKENETLPSYFASLRTTINKPLLSRQELERLILHDPLVKGQTLAYREMKLIDRKKAENMKRNSQAICPSILFRRTGRQLEDFGKETLWMMLDYDHTDEAKDYTPNADEANATEAAIAQVIADPHTLVCYRTISGEGFRILMRYERPASSMLTVTELHRLSLLKAMEHYDQLLGLKADRQCLDMTRLCGLAHDEKAYFNWDARPFSISQEEMNAYFEQVVSKTMGKTQGTNKALAKGTARSQAQGAVNSGDLTTDQIITAVLDQASRWMIRFEPGSHHAYVLQFAKFCHRYGADKESLLAWLNAEYGSQYDGIVSIVDWVYGREEDFGTWHLYVPGEGYSRNPSVKAIMQWIASRYELRFNTVTNQSEIQALDTQHDFYYKWTPIDDTVEHTLFCLMDMDGLRTTERKLDIVIKSHFTKDHNPLKEFIESLYHWDESMPDYITALADYILVAEDKSYYHTREYFRYAFRKWFVGMVASWCDKNTVNELVLILVGKGGIYKTKFFENLLPPHLRRYYANDSSADYGSKDFQQTCSSKALICLDEFDTPHGKNLNAFKSCVTKRSITLRIPYDRYPTELLHNASLCGTSNHLHILGDEEDRRCLVWEVKKILSPFDNPIDYENVYAQAIALARKVNEQKKKGYKERGWVYWLTSEDHDKQSIHNRRFMVNNYLEEQILKYYRLPVMGSSDEGAQNYKFVTASDVIDRVSTNQVFRMAFSTRDLSAVMERLGFKKLRRHRGMGWAVIEKEGYDINQESRIGKGEVEGNTEENTEGAISQNSEEISSNSE